MEQRCQKGNRPATFHSQPETSLGQQRSTHSLHACVDTVESLSVMTQPSPAAVLVDEAHIRPPWQRSSPRPSYKDLRHSVKPEPVSSGHHENWLMTRTATTNSSATSATSRSPSPATPSESSQYYAASTSSWATSQAARSATDCAGPPKDDEPLADRFRRGGSWNADDENPRLPLRRPSTPVSRFARSVRDTASRSPSRPSSLRNSMSIRDHSENEAVHSEQPETDMSDSEEETAGESDTDNEDDNEWSGQNGNLESLIIEAVDGDLSLAAFLVPVLHHEFQLALKSKVDSWQCTTAHGSADGPPASKPSSGELSRGQDGSNSRKRRRRSSSDGGGREGQTGGDGDEGDEDEDRDGDLGQTPPDGTDSTPTLACPFHKRDPVKYGIQPGTSAGTKKHKYRGCIGPGYKSIQRLKEHLKRVHSPVQCDRCYEIFPGSLKERAACLARLADHRKMAVSCERGDASNKEGIDEFQWAILDKQSRKKNQEAHRVEKWYEIWDVLFPEAGVERPENPWNDLAVPHQSKQSSTYGEESFAKLFVSMMEHKVRQKEIDAEVFESIRRPIASVARQALRAHINIRGAPSTETSSSESKNRPSLGSSAQLSGPATTASHQLSAPTAATSITAGSPIRGRAATNTTYTLSPPYHNMGIPMARQHSQQPTPQFTHMPPIPQSGLGHQVPAGNMASFAGITAADDPSTNFYAFNYMFTPPPPPHHQGHHPNTWAGPNSVAFPAPHTIPQNYPPLAGAEYYGEVPDYGQGRQEDV